MLQSEDMSEQNKTIINICSAYLQGKPKTKCGKIKAHKLILGKEYQLFHPSNIKEGNQVSETLQVNLELHKKNMTEEQSSTPLAVHIFQVVYVQKPEGKRPVGRPGCGWRMILE